MGERGVEGGVFGAAFDFVELLDGGDGFAFCGDLKAIMFVV